MAKESIPPYVDLPGLNATKARHAVGLIGGATLIALLCIAGAIAIAFTASPISGWNCVLMWSLTVVVIIICLVGVPLLSSLYQPIVGFDCLNEQCRKYIAADDPWICGHCDLLHKPERIKKTIGYDFKNCLTEECSKCSRLPSSYLCHHCGEIIFLSSERNGQHPARAAEKKYPEAKKVAVEDDWKAQIERMIAEKMAFSTITQKVCELRDAELKRIEEDQTIDRPTKGQLIEFEKQWANKKLQELKMRVVKSR
jgi:hypothetical protein